MGSEHQGRVALVTGAGSGIGRAAALRLAQEGASVAVVDLNAEAAAKTLSLIEAAGGRAITIAADISREDENARMFAETAKAFGGVDYAFLNAGVMMTPTPLAEVTAEVFERVVGVNLRGAFFGAQQALRTLRSGGACVVTASTAGLLGFAEAAAYSMSKHGVIGLVRSGAASFSERNLRINAICPGMVLTPMNAFAIEDSVQPADTLPNAPYRGGMSSQQVAEVALFLLSQRASGMNGQATLVDAALLASFPPLDTL